MKTLLLKLLGISQVVWDFVRPIFTKGVSNFLEKLLPIALSIVKEIATSQNLPNEKRDIAVAQVRSAAIAAGLDVSTSLLNLIVETAYQKYKTEDNSK